MIRVRQIKLSILNNKSENLKKKIAQVLHIKLEDILAYEINKLSLDARDKENIVYVYEIDVKVKNEKQVIKRLKSSDIFLVKKEIYELPKSGNEPINNRPVIVGAGPAGLFAALILASAGYKPIIIEQGKMVEERCQDVDNFWEKGILNVNSNVQFGEGGAGTFSDGKLNTLIKDKRNLGKKVLETFVECGAPEEIMYVNNPHIGTDNLRQVIKNLRQEIINLGGKFCYNTKLTDLIVENNKLVKIIINDREEIPADVLVLAIGHSARDTFYMLKDKGINLLPKPFAVGVRVMHKQEMIDKNQYGNFFKYLPPASYKLTYKTKDNRGVYSFCMCPGGYVVNASSELKHLAINGMSNYKRDSGIANSAIVMTVSPKDYGEDTFAGINFQRQLESKMYNLENGKIPIQLWSDFKKNQKSLNIKTIKPMVKGAYALTNLREVLPTFITESLLEAIPEFEKKIKGFAADDMLICGIESRTSSPIRIVRDEDGVSNILGIYPCGEGAGYAGGITTSAIDGIKVAEWIIKKYKKFN